MNFSKSKINIQQEDRKCDSQLEENIVREGMKNWTPFKTINDTRERGTDDEQSTPVPVQTRAVVQVVKRPSEFGNTMIWNMNKEDK